MSTAAMLGRHWQVLRDSWALENERGRNRQRWREADFLPAALEVVETPPSPIGRAILWAIMGFIAVAILWSVLARVDVVAVAEGRLIAEGRNAVIQAADGGVVRSIHVRDGQVVRAGQPLLSLDPTTAGADRAQAQAALAAARVTKARSEAILRGLRGGGAAFLAPPGTPTLVASAEARLVEQRLAEVEARVAALRAQAAEAEAQIGGSRAEAARLRDTLPLLAERVERRRTLTEKGLSSKLVQLELEQQRLDHERRIGVEQQAELRATATLAAARQQIAAARAEAAREALAELSQAETEIRQREEELRKADQREGLQLLRSPIDGTVQQLAVFTAGAVLKPADPVLVVVPRDAHLLLEAKVLNKDAGFVREGQPVGVKLAAFPFTRYGLVQGRLVGLSRDSIADEKLGPVYTARVALLGNHIDADGRRVQLTPGLMATAEIKTQERRVIDYLLSPLERRVSEAGRER